MNAMRELLNTMTYREDIEEGGGDEDEEWVDQGNWELGHMMNAVTTMHLSDIHSALIKLQLNCNMPRPACWSALSI